MNRVLVSVVGILALVHCSSGDSEYTSTIYPSGLSIASPTNVEAQGNDTNSLIAIGNFDSTASYAQKRKQLEELASGASECTFAFPNFTTPFNDPECYGPKLFYNNHPDGGDVEAQGSDLFPSLQAGDLGLWNENEGEQACAAAKLNQEVGNVGQRVDAAMLFVAGVSCLIEREGDLDIPDEGESVDLTESFADAIADDTPAITVNAVSLERLSDASDGFEVFQYDIEAEDSSGREFEVHLKQHPTNNNGSTYKGKLWASFETGNATEFVTANSFAFSVLFERNEETLNYQMLSTTYSRDLVADDMFDTDNNLSPSACNGDNCWENFAQTIGNIDTETGLGTMSYGWQAGTNDLDGQTPLARIFNVYTIETDDQTRGYAYFGFGRGFSQSNGTIGSNIINRFICNWAGPANNRSGLEFTAQKQSMTLNESAGRFESDDALIAYAPKNSCDYDGSGSFAYSTDNSVDLDDEDNEAGPLTNNLVNTANDDDFENFEAPVIPEEDF